jgi:hypothetical protein
MAANYIELDKSTEFGRNLARGGQLLLEGLRLLVQARDNMMQARDGDGTDAAHYDLLASEAGYVANDYATANAAAKASFDELDSLLSKINTDNSVSNTRAAIYQFAAKHNLVG